jgi:hypothetical protein
MEKKKTYITLEVPIEGQSKPMRVSYFLSDRELELMTKYVKEGMSHWEAFKAMRKEIPESQV